MRYPGWDKKRGRDMTSKLEGWVVGNIEEFSKKVISTEIKYRCVSGG